MQSSNVTMSMKKNIESFSKVLYVHHFHAGVLYICHGDVTVCSVQWCPQAASSQSGGQNHPTLACISASFEGSDSKKSSGVSGMQIFVRSFERCHKKEMVLF